MDTVAPEFSSWTDVEAFYSDPHACRKLVDLVMRELAGLVPVGQPVHFEISRWLVNGYPMDDVVKNISFNAIQIYPVDEAVQSQS